MDSKIFSKQDPIGVYQDNGYGELLFQFYMMKTIIL